MKLRTSWLLAAALVIPGTAQADEPMTPEAHVTGESHKVFLKSVSPRLMAWWLDPAHNKGPASVDSAQAFLNKVLIPLPTEDETAKRTVMFALPAGVQRIVPLEAQKSLLVYGTAAGTKELQKTIALLDQQLRRVEIKAQFVEISLEDMKSLGLESSDTPGFFATGFLRADYAATLQELVKQEKAKVTDVPPVTAINNLLTSLTPVPPAKAEAGTDPNADWLSFQGMKLDVTPTVNNDGTITLNIAGGKIRQPNAEAGVEEGNTNQIQSIINVKDGDTMAIIGFDSRLLPNDLNAEPANLLLIVTPRVVVEKPAPKTK